MRKFVLITKNKLGKYFTYFIINEEKPTSHQIIAFLSENGKSFNSDNKKTLEYPMVITEITLFQKLDGELASQFPTDDQADVAADILLENWEGVNWDDLANIFKAGVNFCKTHTLNN